MTAISSIEARAKAVLSLLAAALFTLVGCVDPSPDDRAGLAYPNGYPVAAGASGAPPHASLEIASWQVAQNVSVVTYGADPTGTSDSSAAIQQAMNSVAGTGTTLTVPAGTYLIQHAMQVPDNITIIGTAGAIINSQMAYVDGHTNIPFRSQPYDTATAVTTLSANVVQGGRTISVLSAASLAINQDIILSSQDIAGELQAGYTIQGITGTTVTVDRPILKPFTAGAQVAFTTRGFSRNINIIGNGMVGTGTGDRFFQIVMARDCHISGVRLLNVSGQQIVASYDYGSLRSTWRDMVIQSTSGSGWGLTLEDGEFGGIEDSYVTGVANGIVLNECEHCWATGSTAEGNQIGFLSAFEGTGAHGTQNSAFVNDHAIGNSQSGIEIDTSTDFDVADSTAQFNALDGLVAQTRSNHVRISGGVYSNNGRYGIDLNSNGTAAMTHVRTANNSSSYAGVFVSMNTQISELDTTEPSTGVLVQNNSQSLVISGWRHTGASYNGVASALMISGTGDRVIVDGARVESFAGTGGKVGFFVLAPSTLVLDRSIVVPAIFAGVYLDAGAVARIGSSVDVSATSNGFYTTGAGNAAYNFGTITLSGATPVSVPFSDAKATDHLILTPRAGGTAPCTSPPAWTVTPGTGFTVVDTTASCNDVYDYRISS